MEGDPGGEGRGAKAILLAKDVEGEGRWVLCKSAAAAERLH